MSNKQALDFPNLLIKRIDNKILLVKINRPNHRNAVNPATAEELYKIFTQFENDNSLKIAILMGEGPCFCAGYDLQHLANTQHKEGNSSLMIDKWKKFEEIAPMGISRLKLSKPVIGAVTSFAVAGGLELALWCDLIVTHKEAVFGVFCRRFGVPLIDGGTVRLAKIVGLNRARDMILTGRPIQGEEAYNWGLANRLVSRDQVLQESINLANVITQHPERCMLSDRQSLMDCTFPQYERDMMNEFKHGLDPMLHGETVRGATNFSKNKEGRSGKFKIEPKL